MPNRRQLEQRARWARTNNTTLLVNQPDGFPSDPEYGPVWWWGIDTPFHQPMAPGAALASVTRATSLIANTLTATPWRLLSGSADPNFGLIELPAPRWVNDPMLFRPDERYGLPSTPSALRIPRAGFWANWIRSVIQKGMGYLIFEESADLAPIPGTMRILNPDVISPESEPYVHRRIGSEDGTSQYVDTNFEGRFILGNRTYRLVEMNNPLAQPDVFGITPGILEMHAAELGLAAQAVTYAQGTYRSGIPSGILKVSSPSYTKEQAQKLRDDFLAHHGGDQRSIAVLNAGIDFNPLAMSPLDLALMESRKMSLIDVSNAFGVPVYLLGGDTGGLNYTNAESRSLDFRTFSLLSWAKQVEEVLSALLPQFQYISVDFRGLLRSDTTTRYAAYEKALTNGWLTLPEIRTLEGLPPLPESLEGAPVPPALTAPDVPPVGPTVPNQEV